MWPEPSRLSQARNAGVGPEMLWSGLTVVVGGASSAWPWHGGWRLPGREVAVLEAEESAGLTLSVGASMKAERLPSPRIFVPLAGVRCCEPVSRIYGNSAEAEWSGHPAGGFRRARPGTARHLAAVVSHFVGSDRRFTARRRPSGSEAHVEDHGRLTLIEVRGCRVRRKALHIGQLTRINDSRNALLSVTCVIWHRSC